MPTNRLVLKEEVATYAAVLLDALYEAGGQERVLDGREQLHTVAKYVRSSIELKNALADSGGSPEKNSELIKNTFSELGFDSLLVEVLGVMAERGNMGYLAQVYTSYNQLLENKLGIVVVDVITKVALNDSLRQRIEKKTATDLGKNVVLRESIDESLLGGIIMSAQGKRIDASIVSQLESARRVLKTTTDGGEG